jgi:hypothetical protein
MCGSHLIIKNSTYLSLVGYLRRVKLKQPILGLQDHLGISKLEEQKKLYRKDSLSQTHPSI